MLLTIATGSPGELGLLDALANEFSKESNIKIQWIKAGSGESLALLKAKKVDIAMVHAPKAEKEALIEGWADTRKLIGSNEFYILGPKSDPAGIKNATLAINAYEKIASSNSLFYTRADNSGTHKKELQIWNLAKITPKGSWYQENKDFMLATLLKADKNQAYFMSDSSTWVVAKKNIKNLQILYKGDPILINTYVTLKQNGLDTLNKQKSKDFIDFVISTKGQKIIRIFGISDFKEPLYNDAEYAMRFFT